MNITSTYLYQVYSKIILVQKKTEKSGAFVKRKKLSNKKYNYYIFTSDFLFFVLLFP